MTLDEAAEAFMAAPSNATAYAYMATLMEYEADGMIGDDTWLDGLASIRNFLMPAEPTTNNPTR